MSLLALNKLQKCTYGLRLDFDLVDQKDLHCESCTIGKIQRIPIRAHNIFGDSSRTTEPSDEELEVALNQLLEKMDEQKTDKGMYVESQLLQDTDKGKSVESQLQGLPREQISRAMTDLLTMHEKSGHTLREHRVNRVTNTITSSDKTDTTSAMSPSGGDFSGAGSWLAGGNPPLAELGIVSGGWQCIRCGCLCSVSGG